MAPDPAPRSQPALLPLRVHIAMAAQMLGIGRTKLYQLIKRGGLETIQLDDSVLMPVRSLEPFVARHATRRPSE